MDPADDAGHLLNRTGGGIDVGAPQFRCQQVPPAEDVKRQIAVTVVIAVEEAAFLKAVQRIIDGIEVERNLLGRLGSSAIEFWPRSAG